LKNFEIAYPLLAKAGKKGRELEGRNFYPLSLACPKLKGERWLFRRH